MAKRPTTRSKANDTAAPAAPRPKRTRAAAQPRAAEQNPVGPSAAEPSTDDIRRRAYERYEERGGSHGGHFDDWLEAEKELKNRK
jgi:hypothetical protein